MLQLLVGCRSPQEVDPSTPLVVETVPTAEPLAPTDLPESPQATELVDAASEVEPKKSEDVRFGPNPNDTLPLDVDGATLIFAAIGDYGKARSDASDVANLVKGWQPDFIITLGDNNYPHGGADTIDRNIGKFYNEYISPYQGAYGPGGFTNRFWPSLGNHDWKTAGAQPYLDYFSLPGNERYYEVDYGLVHLFALDSDSHEPDGITADSNQAAWLKTRLAASNACFQIVYFHDPPYSSGFHGNFEAMQWPFESWGADVVLTGHDHSYERLFVGEIPYFVNGLGGKSIYDFEKPGNLPDGVESLFRYNKEFGAMKITATRAGIMYEFYNIKGKLIDRFVTERDC